MILLRTSAQNQIKKSRNEAESHPMRMMWTVAILLAAWAFGTQTASAQGKKIDLRTKDGVATVKGQWKYHDVKIVEVDGKGPDGKPNKTYNIEPKAEAQDFDDSQWETIAPETLKDRRAGGQVCFCWYRIKITLPPEVAGKAVFFQTTVDDYGEVWVNWQVALGHRDRQVRRSFPGSTPPTASNSRTPSQARSTRLRFSGSTDRSRHRPPTGSSLAIHSWTSRPRSDAPDTAPTRAKP